jgi:hypothetical protein
MGGFPPDKSRSSRLVLVWQDVVPKRHQLGSKHHRVHKPRDACSIGRLVHGSSLEKNNRSLRYSRRLVQDQRDMHLLVHGHLHKIWSLGLRPITKGQITAVSLQVSRSLLENEVVMSMSVVEGYRQIFLKGLLQISDKQVAYFR